MWWVWAISALLHLGLVGAVTVSWNRQVAPKALTVVKTRLVKLGNLRNPKFMPRIERPADHKAPTSSLPPPASQPKLPSSSPQVPEVSVEDALGKLDTSPDLDDLIAGTVGRSVQEGDPGGSTMGTSVNGRIQAAYEDKLAARIHSAFQLPGILSEEQKKNLRATVEIRIGSDGTLLGATLASSSSHEAFDNLVLDATRKSVPYPAPPKEVADRYRLGVTLAFCPLQCQ